MDQIVPLTSLPNQSLNVSLSIDGGILNLNLAVRFNAMAGYWVMAIFDSSNNLLVNSIPLVTGAYPAANLLEQQGYLGIGSPYMLNVAGVAQDYPDATNLGTAFQLLWGNTATS